MTAAAARLGFQYVTVRCVPRADREEFVNVGVVVYCQDADFLGAETWLDTDRLYALAPDLDVAGVRQALDAIDAACLGTGAPFGAMARGPRFGWLTAPRSTVIRPSPIHGGITADPARELELLVGRLVR